MAELILVVGLVGAGKTTRASHLATSIPAVRLSPDEWMAPLFGHADPDGMRDVLEGRLIYTAVDVLRTGASVILDFGLWGRDERASLAWLAGTVGASTRTLYLPVDRETQAQRVAQRWQQTPEQTWPITQAELDRARALLQEPDADELVGTYTTSPPDDSSWEQWICTRWPTALSAWPS